MVRRVLGYEAAAIFAALNRFCPAEANDAMARWWEHRASAGEDPDTATLDAEAAAFLAAS